MYFYFNAFTLNFIKESFVTIKVLSNANKICWVGLLVRPRPCIRILPKAEFQDVKCLLDERLTYHEWMITFLKELKLIRELNQCNHDWARL